MLFSLMFSGRFSRDLMKNKYTHVMLCSFQSRCMSSIVAMAPRFFRPKKLNKTVLYLFLNFEVNLSMSLRSNNTCKCSCTSKDFLSFTYEFNLITKKWYIHVYIHIYILIVRKQHRQWSWASINSYYTQNWTSKPSNKKYAFVHTNSRTFPEYPPSMLALQIAAI